jgi:hypothetical protein
MLRLNVLRGHPYSAVVIGQSITSEQMLEAVECRSYPQPEARRCSYAGSHRLAQYPRCPT